MDFATEVLLVVAFIVIVSLMGAFIRIRRWEKLHERRRKGIEENYKELNFQMLLKVIFVMITILIVLYVLVRYGAPMAGMTEREFFRLIMHRW